MAQPARDDQGLYYSDMPVGEVLRQARLHYGQSLVDVERALRIRASQLDAIESGNFEKLPGKVYAIGFIRSYSEYLGLDAGQMVQLFKSQANTKQIDPALHFPVGASESKLPSVWVVIFSCLVFIGILGYWWSTENQNRGLVQTIVLPEDGVQDPMGPFIAEANLNQDIAAAAATAASTEPAAAATPEPGITLHIVQNSWVEIKDQTGEQLVSRVLKQGEVYFVPERPDLFMSLGNAAGVSLEINGETITAMGGRGEVLRNIPLDSKYLLENFSFSLDQSAQ